VTRKSRLFAKKTSDLLPCLAKTIIFDHVAVDISGDGVGPGFI